ncbi:hypothetical protein EDI_167670 [Entamoeba dispar SAW760]|uniref:NIF system FeS cluster assembly NifU C-terminal domain-containing protein n=1 Tax=Entamoeba dispar (strain ATCC PRA-260 / SAW760) TaxID=370354 RepID=B0EP33_ENTDS|nr:uncharacterized protein EDI_167670 [Entamoeba dispar SAW760]EDR23708.1 hypothetical protein EDI_167670 [Entamoeba dispar SAW760]|eukprot:EDR23708.1 hypothetical protein EDI_167670 [Entamoeba dispar SAW760]
MVKKISKLNQVFEQYIDPIVKKDGGNVEVYEVKDGVNGEIIVYIQYSGKCVGCAAANGATKEKIQTILRDTLSKKIIVIPVDLPHTHDDDLIEQLENETTLNIKKRKINL